jgi:hypothetical protein
VHLASAVAQASDVAFDLADIVGQDVIDRPDMLFSQSYVPYLLDKIGQLGDAPLLTLDLRDGRYWWSTRLYAVATLAHEHTSLEWLLFVERGDQYVGMVRPAVLRRALAIAEPQLEEHYHEAKVPPLVPGIDPRFRAGQLHAVRADHRGDAPPEGRRPDRCGDRDRPDRRGAPAGPDMTALSAAAAAAARAGRARSDVWRGWGAAAPPRWDAWRRSASAASPRSGAWRRWVSPAPPGSGAWRPPRPAPAPARRPAG